MFKVSKNILQITLGIIFFSLSVNFSFAGETNEEVKSCTDVKNELYMEPAKMISNTIGDGYGNMVVYNNEPYIFLFNKEIVDIQCNKTIAVQGGKISVIYSNNEKSVECATQLNFKTPSDGSPIAPSDTLQTRRSPTTDYKYKVGSITVSGIDQVFVGDLLCNVTFANGSKSTVTLVRSNGDNSSNTYKIEEPLGNGSDYFSIGPNSYNKMKFTAPPTDVSRGIIIAKIKAGATPNGDKLTFNWSIDNTTLEIKNTTSEKIIFYSVYSDLEFINDKGDPFTLFNQKLINGKENKVFGTILDSLDVVVKIMNLLLAPLILLIGWLLSPDWTFGDFIGLRPMLHTLWIFIFNMVYIIFALLIIGIGVYNIFTEGKDSFAIKTAIPRLVVSLIMVPLTWFLISVIISISSLMSAALLQLPKEAIESLSSSDSKYTALLDKPVIPSEFIYYGSGGYDVGGRQLKDRNGQSDGKNKYQNLYGYTDCDNNPSGCKSIKSTLQGSSAYNILLSYTYGVFGFHDMGQKIEQSIIGYLQTGTDTIIHVVVWMLFFIIFVALMVALALALVTRAIILWIYAIFSPIFALTYFFNGKLPLGNDSGGLSKYISFKSFLGLAMVPVYVSAALAFSFMFITIAVSGIKDSPPGMNSNIVSYSTGTNGDKNFKFNEPGITFTMKGNGAKDDLGDITGGLIGVGLDFIQSLIICIIALILLWITVMAALKSNEITGKAVKEIDDFGSGMGKLIGSLPKYAPLPIPGAGSISMNSLTKIPNTMSSTLQTIDQNRFNDGLGKKIQTVFNMDPDTKAMLDTVTKTTQGLSDSLSTFHDVLGKGTDQQFVTQDAYKKALNFRLEDLRNNGAFSNDAKATELIGKINSASNQTDLRDRLLELNRIAKEPNKGILGLPSSEVDRTRIPFKKSTGTSSETVPETKEEVKKTEFDLGGKKIDYDLDKDKTIKIGEKLFLIAKNSASAKGIISRSEFDAMCTVDTLTPEQKVSLEKSLEALGIDIK
ncbi:MAG: hypothetical protein PHF46_01145 [Candidatus Gracilibacteria bacterium]|nr:hypothetical protein [Candidatus Gracilibacteria bacterium]